MSQYRHNPEAVARTPKAVVQLAEKIGKDTKDAEIDPKALVGLCEMLGWDIKGPYYAVVQNKSGYDKDHSFYVDRKEYWWMLTGSDAEIIAEAAKWNDYLRGQGENYREYPNGVQIVDTIPNEGRAGVRYATDFKVTRGERHYEVTWKPYYSAKAYALTEPKKGEVFVVKQSPTCEWKHPAFWKWARASSFGKAAAQFLANMDDFEKAWLLRAPAQDNPDVGTCACCFRTQVLDRRFAPVATPDKGDSVEFVYKNERLTGKVVRVKNNGTLTVDVENPSDEDMGWVDVNVHALTSNTKSLHMVLHGYERPGFGYILGKCEGTRFPPYELSDEGTRFMLSLIEPTYLDFSRQLALYNAGGFVNKKLPAHWVEHNKNSRFGVHHITVKYGLRKLREASVEKGYEKEPAIVKSGVIQPGDAEYTQVYREMGYLIESGKREYEQQVLFLRKMIAEWKLRPLPIELFTAQQAEAPAEPAVVLPAGYLVGNTQTGATHAITKWHSVWMPLCAGSMMGAQRIGAYPAPANTETEVTCKRCIQALRKKAERGQS